MSRKNCIVENPFSVCHSTCTFICLAGESHDDNNKREMRRTKKAQL